MERSVMMKRLEGKLAGSAMEKMSKNELAVIKA
jgi:hypothetical protein